MKKHWVWLGMLALSFCGCKSKSSEVNAATNAPAAISSSSPAQMPDDNTPPPEKMGGFDGKLAFSHVMQEVSFGPRPSGSAAIAQLQDYILSRLSSYGCTVETDAFTADTPLGRIPMKNILVKIPGLQPGIIMLATHYDTKRMDNFLGADDGGSSTGVMMELARLLCAQQNKYAVWIAFFDGEEAVQQWSETDSRYGSREMAAKMAMSKDLPKVRAFLLADIVGSRMLRFKRELNSSKQLTDLVWEIAGKSGYASIFVNDATSIEDDHLSFSKRGVPTVDVIDLEIPYWHTPQDTMDKISSTSLAITGYVFLESVKQLQQK